MKIKNIKIFTLLIALSPQLLAFSSNAQEDIYADPLYSNEQIYYKPITPDVLEAEKLRALGEKDAKTMYVIGMMYRDGQNVDPDVVQAQEWFKHSAEEGNSDSMVELARIYSLDKEFTGLDKNQPEALRWINEAEKRNNAKALYTLGTMYEDGFPVERSYEKSFEYYKKAAYRGILNAYVKLYIAYQYGKGVDPDLKKAIYWLRKIQKEAPDGKIKDYAKQMLSDAYFEVGLTEVDPALKFKMFNLAWSNGNRYAIEAIGDMFQAGVGVRQNYPSAVVAYETAIKNYESVYSMERLGFIYLKGPAEINRDYKKAFDLFAKAADLGGVTAAYELGYMHYYGLGTTRNPTEANKWFARSSQLASRKQQPKYVSPNDASNRQLQNIISATAIKDIEIERQKNIQRQLDASDYKSGEVPQINEVPRY